MTLNSEQLQSISFWERSKDKKDFDGVNIQFVEESWKYIANALLDIVNESLVKGIFSDCWNKSSVVTMEKIASASKCEGFRPIDILSTFEERSWNL